MIPFTIPIASTLCAEYIVTYRSEKEDDTVYHRRKGFFRCIPLASVQNEIDKMTTEYCERNNLYPTFVEHVFLRTSPDLPCHLIHERMYGVSLKYHYLPVEPNVSSNMECVYLYLLDCYGRYIKSLTKESLLEIFGETNPKNGVTTFQIIEFCRLYNINCYALDLEFHVFKHFKPEKSSHKFPSLVFVVANKHLLFSCGGIC